MDQRSVGDNIFHWNVFPPPSRNNKGNLINISEILLAHELTLRPLADLLVEFSIR